MNKRTIDFDKLRLGISCLTERIYIYYPDKDDTAKYQIDVTDQFKKLAKSL